MSSAPLRLLPLLLAMAAFFNGCGTTSSDAGSGKNDILQGQSVYVSAFTKGEVDRNARIRVRLRQDAVPPSAVGQPVEDSPLELSPSLKGEAHWEDRRSFVFEPSGLLPNDQTFDARFDLQALIDTIPSELEDLRFSFYTPPQDFELELTPLEAMDDHSIRWQQWQGAIYTQNIAEAEAIESMLRLEGNAEGKPVRWGHTREGHEHRFTIDSIPRREEAYTLELTFVGEAIGAEGEETRRVEVPAEGNFALREVQAVANPEQYAELTFSDPLDGQQDLRGLVRLGSGLPLRAVVRANKVLIYPKAKVEGETQIRIESGLRNFLGKPLGTAIDTLLVFEESKPSLRRPDDGVIVPSSRKALPFTFEAVNLRAVDVRIRRIYEDNVLQFLQFNRLRGSDYMQYVGKVVREFTLSLEGNGNRRPTGQWQRHQLDLSELIETQPGAIYQIEMRYRKAYARYNCPGGESEAASEEESESFDYLTQDKEGLFDYYDRYVRYQSGAYDDPCTDYYYFRGEGEGISANVLASDIGLLAKRGPEGDMFFAATDLRTTEPLAGLELSLYNLQQQRIQTITTNAEGIARTQVEEPPFAAVARQGDRRGYLKLNDAALSLSKFKVEGEAVREGIKGFIYTERGVWRPGDSIHVGFILEDVEGVLPKAHPVVFSLVNPRGQQVAREVRPVGENGFFTFRTQTGLNAPTGRYTLQVDVGGVVFEKSLSVETIQPNRLKVQLDFTGDKRIVADDQTIGQLTSRWLHGGSAAGLRAEVEAALEPVSMAFDDWQGYRFTDPTSDFERSTLTLFEGELDGSGTARIENNIDYQQRLPGQLQANIEARVYEAGGNFSVGRFRVPYHPYTAYVGLERPQGMGYADILPLDERHRFEVASVTPEGEAAGGRTVTLSLYELAWRWWWDAEEGVSRFNRRESQRPLRSETVRTGRNGKASWTLKLPRGREGRYLLRACHESGHCAGEVIYFDHDDWYRRRDDQASDGANLLVLTPDRESYQVGDSVRVDIPTGFEGKALVTLESGRKVLRSEWIDARPGGVTYRFQATPEMSPNIYAAVTVLQPHAQTTNDLPLRMYGVAPIDIEDPATRLQPEIALPEVLRPETQATIEVSEAGGQAMSYTLALVDEGLLDLTNFPTPAPHAHFYAREALQITTWDLFEEVVGAYPKEGPMLSLGGGFAGAAQDQGNTLKRFEPMVRFLGPFRLKKGQVRRHELAIPNYIGSVRAMVVAGDQGAYGHADTAVPVRKPVMVLPTLPRILRPGERLDMPVSVFAMEEGISKVNVQLETNEGLRVLGNDQKSVRFPQTGEELVTFELKASQKPGLAKAVVTAQSGKETARYAVELEIKPANFPRSRVVSTSLPSRDTASLRYAGFGLPGTNEATLEVSAFPPLRLQDRLGYLLRYPYGCLEQTTSTAFAQLYLDRLVELEAARKSEVQENIEAAIQRMPRFQQSNGGLSYWPGGYFYGYRNDGVHPWATNYGGHFLLAARDAGYALPNGLLPRWKNYQQRAAREWSLDDEQMRASAMTQAYRLYGLALAGDPDFASMNRLRESKGLYPGARWRLAGAYLLAGQDAIAQQLVAGLSTDMPDYRELGHTFGSDLRDEAMVLETLIGLEKRAAAYRLLQRISRAMNSDQYLSTQTTAYCLFSAARYAEAFFKEGSMQFAWRLEDGASGSVQSEAPTVRVPLGGDTLRHRLRLENQGGQALHASVSYQGTPPAGAERAQQNGVRLEVSYTTPEGYSIDLSQVPQGEDIRVQYTVINPDNEVDLEEMALAALFPSGWRLLNPRMSEVFDLGGNDAFDYIDLRDDRAYLYFDLPHKAPSRYDSDRHIKTFRVALNASYTGRYYLPGVICQAMYDETIQATTKGRWVEVVPRAEVGAN